jgi:uncharacterized RDD family membrane protein YckC
MRIVGTGTRVLSFLVDFAIISLLTFGVFRGWLFYVFYYHIPYIPFYYFLALITFIYYLIFEAIWKRTPGKWLSLSKVVSKDGSQPTFGQIVIRNLVRVASMVILDSIFLSFLNKTLHDYASRTEVIEV